MLLKKIGSWLLAGTLLVGLAAGCGTKAPGAGNSNGNGAAQEKHEPITLTMYQYGNALTDADYQKLFEAPVKAKFPYITLNLIKAGPGTNPPDIIASGQLPDILFSSNPKINELNELGLLADLNPLIKQNNTDIGRFEPVLVDAIKQYAKGGELYALPFSRNFTPLFYNKDIFDKFGVAYPKDGMTTDDVLALAQKVTRTDNGVAYLGFDFGQVPQAMGTALSLNLVDPKTSKASIDTDGWKKVFTFMQKVYTIPGNMPEQSLFTALGKIRTEFTDGKLAMFVDKGNGMVPLLQGLEDNNKPLNWDMATMPNFPEAVGKEEGVDIHLFEVCSKTKYPAEAFKVIDYLTSKDVEMIASKGGRVSSLTDAEVSKSYGAELSTLKGKHLDAIFKVKPSKLQYPSEFNDVVQPTLVAAFKDVILNGKDINTALREAQDAADKAIAEKKAQ
ncbi:MAG: extracellular solute-binding protein family 1 [Paenibacillaceae bacterium]|jgi:multiple sugar transport system substrate-binding protein|nr:extracellular solute-binding protein family 1 [Paenibacillaceae bacterium]